MNLEFYNDKIEAYLLHQLSPEERAAFEAEVAANPSLQKEITKFKNAQAALERIAQDELKSKIKQWRKETPVIAIRPQWTLPRAWVAAAAVLLIAIIATGFIIQKNRYSDAALALRYLQIYEEGATMGDQVQDKFAEGVRAFDEEDYSQAITLLSSIPSENPNFDKAQLYIGTAHMKLKNFDKAAQAFDRILSLDYSLYQDLAQWNLLTAWLGAGRTDANFQNLLHQIMKDEDHPYRTKALQLQKDLNSFWR